MSVLWRKIPRFCLKVGTEHLVWMEASRTWWGKRRYRCACLPLQSGLLKFSPVCPNVSNCSALEDRLRTLVGPSDRWAVMGQRPFSKIPRWITLMLPDLAVRTSVIRLEQNPSPTEEQEALIRWRLGQEQRMPLAGMRIRWQLFPARQRNEIGYIALVVAVQDPVLSQYESVCEAAGLLPQEVRVSSFALFDFWLKAAGGERRLNQDIAWVSIADGGLTCLIVHDYRPVFVRTKQLTGEAVEAGDIRSLEWTEKIVRETAASLLACREHYPKLRIKTLILAMDQEVPGLQDALGDELEVKTERFNWDSVRTLGWIYEGGAMPLGALPAVAGMV